jgi:hypothetical protein
LNSGLFKDQVGEIRMHPEGQHMLVTHWSAAGKERLRYNVSTGVRRRLARFSVPIAVSVGAVNRIAVNRK